MSWPPTEDGLYLSGPPESYFAGLPAGAVDQAVLAAYGELATALAPRCGGDPASWTWTHTAGQAHAERDVYTVAKHELATDFGLVLPGEGADPAWLAKAEAVRAKWSRMGTPGVRPAEPLYSGLVDATPTTTEGAPRGWSVALPYAETEAVA